jgi:hypothetical protein
VELGLPIERGVSGLLCSRPAEVSKLAGKLEQHLRQALPSAAHMVTREVGSYLVPTGLQLGRIYLMLYIDYIVGMAL